MDGTRLSGLLGAAAIIVAACGTPAQSGAPSNAPTQAPGATPQPTAAPAEQSITYVIDADLSGGMTNAADNVPTVEAIQFMHNALYEYNEAIEVKPLIAASMAEISADGLTWTLPLRDDVTFHDGTPLTADDVVLTYEMAKSKNCRFSPAACLNAFLQSVEKVDDHTVKFTLTQKLATFATVYLPSIFIENSKIINASYAKFVAGRDQVAKDEVQDLVTRIEAEEAAPTGADGAADYTKFDAELRALLGKAGQTLPDPLPIVDAEGNPDPNGYASAMATQVETLLDSFDAAEIDSLALAYPYLDFQYDPVGLGAGPFKFVSYKSGESIEMAAYDEYFLGKPEVSKLFFPIIKDDLAGGQALAAGQADWKYSLQGATYNQIKNDQNLTFVEYPEFGFYGLYFNLRDGQLFADQHLRQAVASCFDKPETVQAATEGQGIAIWSEIPPASWAYPGDQLETYPYDQAKAKQLIESSGWTLGADGIYEKNGQKLSTKVAVRAGRPDRSAFMQLLSDQVKDCGMDIQYQEVDFSALLTMITVFPHVNAAAPELGKPFDAYFGGFIGGADPDPYSLYHSSQCSTAEQPDTNNYICYANPKVDELIDRGLTTFDQAERTTIYKEYARIQSEDLPVLYGWSDIQHEGLRNTVTLDVPGGMQLDTPYYFARAEKLRNLRLN
jgi:ABC-type transport system substrate-binding protein